ncbi:zinc finger protein RFP-like [Python bivittatus]|uniref:Zinc finger protein RFP-like n=1 Tax=Python bivittatus TaxID=176946 RepID=A0A9F2NVB2_PYTBI|nr:zinc finger protein RFP-like [Python bivittatus]
MATESLLEEFFEVLRCSLCLRSFTDPVMLDCGHNFCRACVLHHWEESGLASSCPECQKVLLQRGGQPNRPLAKVAQLAKKLWEQRRAGKREVCQRHWKPLEHICQDDQALLCVVCKRMKAHKGHVVEPLERVARALKEKTGAQLKAMEEGRKERHQE